MECDDSNEFVIFQDTPKIDTYFCYKKRCYILTNGDHVQYVSFHIKPDYSGYSSKIETFSLYGSY